MKKLFVTTLFTILAVLVFFASGVFAAPAAFSAVQISGDVPASAADTLTSAGFKAVIIYYNPYRTPDDPKIIAHLKQWGEKAKKLGFVIYVRLDTAAPLDAIADTKKIKFRPAGAEDGYQLDHKPAPASEDFWRTAVFPKFDVLSKLSRTMPLKGVYLNLNEHVDVSYDITTFNEFIKAKAPDIDSKALDPRNRRSTLASRGLSDDYEKWQEDAIFGFASDFIKKIVADAPGFEFHLTAWEEDTVHRAFSKAIDAVQPGGRRILYPVRTDRDIKTGGRETGMWTPALSVLDFLPEELSAMVGALDLGRTGFAVMNGEALVLSLRKMNVNAWPLGKTDDYIARLKSVMKKGGSVADERVVEIISDRSIGTHSGVPRVALIYSGYRGYMYRDVFDGPLAAAGIKIDKYENTKLDKLVPRLRDYDSIFFAPGYNAVKPDKFYPYAKDLLRFAQNGGLIFILDASMKSQAEWMGQADPQLTLSVEERDGIKQKSLNVNYKMLNYPNRVTKLAAGKHHFIKVASGWRALATDNYDSPYVVNRLYGKGMIIALADFDINQDFVVNAWEYMLKVLDCFDLEPDSNTKPIGIGKNEVQFVATTFGPERKLVVKVTVMDEERNVQKGERRFTMTAEGGARFKVPLVAKIGGLHRMTLDFYDSATGKMDKRDSFSFLAPSPVEAMAGKSYYTGEQEAVIRVQCRRLSGCGSMKAGIVLKDPSGKAVAKGKFLRVDGRNLYYSLPIGTLPSAVYKASVNVSGAVKAELAVAVKKLPPSDHVESKLLNFRGGLLEVNGKPYFPLGIFSIPAENLSDLAASGVNGMIYYGNTVEAEAKFNSDVEGKGIMFAAYPLYPHTKVYDEDPAAVRKEIADKAENNNLFMWYLADEPEGFGQSAQLIYDAYSFVKKVDPYRPQAIVMMSPEHYYRYVQSADIFMFDRYPTPQSPLNTVGEHARKAVRAVYGRKPVIAIPQAFDWRVWDGSFKDGMEHRPNYTEMRSSAIQSIAAGVTGIIYWAYTASRYDMRKFPSHEKDFRRLMTELSGLLDVLSEPNVPMDIKVNPDFKGIGWGSKIHDGKLYIFSFNGDTSKIDSVKFTLPSHISYKKVEVHGEDRTIMMEANSFKDTFDVLASHIYVIPLK